MKPKTILFAIVGFLVIIAFIFLAFNNVLGNWFHPSALPLMPINTGTPTILNTPTLTRELVSTPTLTSEPASSCTVDLQFSGMNYTETGTQFRFDAPYQISLPITGIEVFVNELPISDITFGASDPRYPNRLFIVSKGIISKDRVQVMLIQNGVCSLSKVIVAP
jgi:hypothetical protein